MGNTAQAIASMVDILPENDQQLAYAAPCMGSRFHQSNTGGGGTAGKGRTKLRQRRNRFHGRDRLGLTFPSGYGKIKLQGILYGFLHKIA